MSSEKEPYYFTTKTFSQENPMIPIRNKKKYLDLFKNVKDEKITAMAHEKTGESFDENQSVEIKNSPTKMKNGVNCTQPPERMSSSI